MLKNLVTILFLVLFSTSSIAAGSSDDSSSKKVKTNYEKAVETIKFAKKYEKKGKLEKAKKKIC